eukprot:gnl/TRDRNA2_/TRDRNA2_79306_c2_seq1.p1 gnl/TRDRNA2_/TRDRNA2_79306_c2~~gnl/TRDRNA2_/TRDRNA2_79306_c2_seq1.p1  ORF type:complete len:264 (-),score=47.90 gnl/TRDRNA2_/TRDRNA2_79306_c2_seq1:5-721(-)
MRSQENPVASQREIFQSYGVMKSNAALLLDYGFALEPLVGGHFAAGDAEATFSIRLEGGVTPDLAASRLKLWKAARRPPTGASVDVTRAEFSQLFSLLRVACAESMDLEEMVSSGVADAHAVQNPMSAALECRVLRKLAELASAALARFPVASDSSCTAEMVHASSWYASVARACAIVVHEEKAVLQFFIDLASHALIQLEGSKPDDATVWLATLDETTRASASDYLASMATVRSNMM